MVSFALHGIGVSGGIAIGRAHLVSHATREVAHYTIPQSQVPSEVERFSTAIHEVQRELEGLHARTSAKLTQLAAKFESDVQVVRNGRKVNAKSIMGVMMLAAGKGAKVTIEIEGPDEGDAMNAIVGLIGDCFGEGQ